MLLVPESSEKRPGSFRAWLYLIWFSFVRHLRARQMVWIALALLVVTIAIVALNTAAGRWTMEHWRFFGRRGPTLKVWLTESHPPWRVAIGSTPVGGHIEALWSGANAIMLRSDLLVFSRGIIILLVVSFLLPIWSLSFATEAIGGDRESQSLLWLLTRPIPRWSIYLAKFLAVLPWTLGLCIGGLWILCAVAGRPGPVAFRLFWPAIFWSALTFSALFLLMGAYFRRPAVMALVYSFFFEVIAGNMPGTLKRVSVGFYTRCIMFEQAESFGLQPTNPIIYEPVSAWTARLILIGATIGLVALGMLLFERQQFEGTE